MQRIMTTSGITYTCRLLIQLQHSLRSRVPPWLGSCRCGLDTIRWHQTVVAGTGEGIYLGNGRDRSPVVSQAIWNHSRCPAFWSFPSPRCANRNTRRSRPRMYPSWPTHVLWFRSRRVSPQTTPHCGDCFLFLLCVFSVCFCLFFFRGFDQRLACFLDVSCSCRAAWEVG